MNLPPSSTSPRRLPRSFQVVAKPLGPVCNLDCTYCYYRHKEDWLPEANTGRIADDLLEEFIRQFINGQEEDPVVFNWHGGEPTLLGLDFFQKVIELERKYAGIRRIENDFQTNGVLLDESWCRFLKENRFYVGLSLDGPKHLHDHFRKTNGGESSFDRVYRAARLLQQYDVPFNPLTVVNAVTARHPDEVYGFLTEELGCTRLQWLPCVAHKDFRTTAPGYWDPSRMPTIGTPAAKPGNPASLVTDWSVDPNDWGEFLCRTFDLWLKNGLGRVVVNWFESLVGQWMGKRAHICTLAPVCGRSLVTMETDGSLYSCDHFVYPEYRLGNLRDENCQLADVVYSPQQRRFGLNKREGLPDCCKQCQYNFACNGECPKNRFLKTPDGQPGLNYLCSGTKRFLAYADPHLRRIAAALHGSGVTQVIA
jgi:uncharacterized protein